MSFIYILTCDELQLLAIATSHLLHFDCGKQVGVGLESKLQEWFHLPQDMASPRWVKQIQHPDYET